MNTANYSASEVAGYFIDKANGLVIEDGVVEGISNLKLQKLLYFAQAAHLVLQDSPLFSDAIEAWKYGPVVPFIYRQYQTYTNEPIPTPQGSSKTIDNSTREFLSNIWYIFGKFTAGQLVEMTHSHKPWKEAYERGANTVITSEALKTYYTGIIVAN